MNELEDEDHGEDGDKYLGGSMEKELENLTNVDDSVSVNSINAILQLIPIFLPTD